MQEVLEAWQEHRIAPTYALVERRVEGEPFSDILNYKIGPIPAPKQLDRRCKRCLFFDSKRNECQAKYSNIKYVVPNRPVCKRFQDLQRYMENLNS